MNQVLLLAAELLRALTCGNLDYVEREHGHDDRPDAGMDLVNRDHVFATDVFGIYLVKARTLTNKATGEPIYYHVMVGDDLDCECGDFRARHGKHDIFCQHVIAAATVHAMRLTFAQVEAWEQAQRSAA
jgi:hypothetical protein